MAENGLAYCMCHYDHCRRVQLLSCRYATSTPHRWTHYDGIYRTSIASCDKNTPNSNLAKTHTHPLYGLLDPVWDYPGEPVPESIWILLKQETVSGSGISWAICKPAPRPRQTTMPAPHHSVFHRPDALPAAQPTALKHWRQQFGQHIQHKIKQHVVSPQCHQSNLWRAA